MQPLRGVRRWLKGVSGPAGAEALRARVKALELEAERLQQERLHAHLPLAGGESSPAAARANLVAYLKAEPPELAALLACLS